MVTLSIVFVVLLGIYGASAEQCTVRDILSSDVSYMYCDNGCCGMDYDRYCCMSIVTIDWGNLSNSVSAALSTGTIIAIVVSIIIFIAIVVGIVLCVVCCARAAEPTPRRVVRTVGPPVAVITQGTVNTAYEPQLAQPPPPYSPAGKY